MIERRKRERWRRLQKDSEKSKNRKDKRKEKREKKKAEEVVEEKETPALESTVASADRESTPTKVYSIRFCLIDNWYRFSRSLASLQ